jgi:hypothetical protein
VTEEEIELTEADVAKFNARLEDWGRTLVPKERGLLHLILSNASTVDPEVVGFHNALDGAPPEPFKDGLTIPQPSVPKPPIEPLPVMPLPPMPL